jgi:Zn-dependent oligopeptidase
VILAALSLSSFGPAGAQATLAPFTPSTVDWSVNVPTIRKVCSNQNAIARTRIAQLAQARQAATFDNTVVPLENVFSDLSDRTVAETFLTDVSPDKAIRDASVDCQNEESAFQSDAAAIPAIYHNLLAVAKSGTARSDADKALLRVYINLYRQAGAGLGERARTQFVVLSKELATIQNQFLQNFANDTTALTVGRAELAGVPDDFVGSLKSNASGQLLLPLNDSTASIIQSNATNENLRRRAYFAFTNIQYPANVKLLERAIQIRYRLAHLLGYPSWAAYQMATRTVTQPSKIDAFLAQLDAHLKGAAAGNVAALAALKAQETNQPGATIEPWDVPFYRNQLQKTRYAVDRNAVRQYFPAPHVVGAIMKIYHRILGVTFTEVRPANAWYSDVISYAVSDTQSGRYIGTLFLDLYPRQGKPGGAFNIPLLSVRREANGTYRPPITAIVVSDWPAPLGRKPALLTHDDVTTFFHEFGHAMAALLTTVPYESLSEFDQDFVEAPSQMLENFTWDPGVLKELSSNVDTGQPMPDALIRNLIAARCVSDRLCNAQSASIQVELSDVDLRYHESGPKVNVDDVWYAVSRADTPVPTAVGAHPAAQFTHLMGGYDASYYVYLWSLVYAQDMFTAFAPDLENPVVGMRYRKTILEPARTYSPDVEVSNFLGRPMSPAAFYQGFQAH